MNGGALVWFVFLTSVAIYISGPVGAVVLWVVCGGIAAAIVGAAALLGWLAKRLGPPVRPQSVTSKPVHRFGSSR